MDKKSQNGFTLIELIVVVTLLSFLVIAAISYFRSQIFKGNDAKRKSDMRNISIAVEEYEKDNNCYPSVEKVVCDPGDGLQPYLEKIPCDVSSDESYYYQPGDGACPKWYRLYTKLDYTQDPDVVTNIGPNQEYNFVISSNNAPDIVVGGSQSNISTPPPGYVYYGCINGSCVEIGWDSNRPGPACDPNYQNSSCYGQCSNPINNCETWNQ